MDTRTASSEDQHMRLLVDNMLRSNHASPVRFRDLVRQAQGAPSCLEDSQSTMVEIATQREVGVEAVEGETEVPRFVPQKRKIDSSDQNMIPPKRRRKTNQVHNAQHENIEKNVPRNEYPTITTSYTNSTSKRKPSDANVNFMPLQETGTQTDESFMTTLTPLSSFAAPSGISTLQSSFSLHKPVTTGMMHSHLASLLDQCKEALVGASQTQHQQEEHIRKLRFDYREEVGRLRRKLDEATSMLVRERETHARTREALSQMKIDFDRERDAYTTSQAKASTLVQQLQSDLEEERQRRQDERLNSQKISAERAEYVAELGKAKEKHDVAVADLTGALRQATERSDRLSTTIERQTAQIKSLDVTLAQLHKDIDSERRKNEALEKDNAETKGRLVTFHFGANILTSYFWMILHANKTRRISTKRKITDDVHDLWDVQAALKRLVDGCTAFVENIPDRHDFYDAAECPLCLPEMPPVTSVGPSGKQLLLKIKKEPVDIRLSHPSYPVPIP